MTNVAEEPIRSAKPTIVLETIEQCICTGCEQLIPRENVTARIQRTTGVRVVQAYCEHCNIGFQINQALRNGEWVICGMVALLDAQAKAALMRDTDRLRRVIQRRTVRERKRIDRAFSDRLAQDASEEHPQFEQD